MRKCGKRYGTEDEALRSKRAQDPTMVVLPCWCEGFHVRKRRAITVAGMAATVSKPAAHRDTIPPKVRRIMDIRDSVDGVRLSVLSGMAGSLHRHHRRLKQMGGDTRPHTDCPCNLVTLEEGEHFWCHTIGRVFADAEGFIVSSSVLFPGSVPVLVHGVGDAGGVLAWPTCSGEWSDVAPGEQVAA
jgi:hypothetical protein